MENVNGLPRWAQVALLYLVFITLFVIIGMVSFHRGALWQCNDLGLKAYKSGDKRLGFTCEPERDFNTIPWSPSYKHDIFNISVGDL